MFFIDYAAPSGVLSVLHIDTIPNTFGGHQTLPDQQAFCSTPMSNHSNIGTPDPPQPPSTTKLSADPFNTLVNIMTPDFPQPPPK